MRVHVFVGADEIKNTLGWKNAEWKEYTHNMFLGKAEQQQQFGSVPGKHSGNGAPNLELVRPVGLVYI